MAANETVFGYRVVAPPVKPSMAVRSPCQLRAWWLPVKHCRCRCVLQQHSGRDFTSIRCSDDSSKGKPDSFLRKQTAKKDETSDPASATSKDALHGGSPARAYWSTWFKTNDITTGTLGRSIKRGQGQRISRWEIRSLPVTENMGNQVADVRIPSAIRGWTEAGPLAWVGQPDQRAMGYEQVHFVDEPEQGKGFTRVHASGYDGTWQCFMGKPGKQAGEGLWCFDRAELPEDATGHYAVVGYQAKVLGKNKVESLRFVFGPCPLPEQSHPYVPVGTGVEEPFGVQLSEVWFEETFDEQERREGVTWARFWGKLEEVVLSKDLNVREIATFNRHRLFRNAQRGAFRKYFQKAVGSATPEVLTADQFEEAIDIVVRSKGTPDDRDLPLHELLDFFMRQVGSGPVEPLLKVEQIDMAFISHTGQDRSLLADVLAAALHRELKMQKRLSFFDADSLKGGDVWAAKIESSVKLCRVFVVILSPSYGKRFWCMRELDIALNEQPGGHGGRRFVPLLLGLDRKKLEAPPLEWQEEWAAIARREGLSPKVDVGRWTSNLKELCKFQAIMVLEPGIEPKKGEITTFAAQVSKSVARLLPLCR